MREADQLKALESYSPIDSVFLQGFVVPVSEAANDAMYRYEVDPVTLTCAHTAGNWGCAPPNVVEANVASLEAARDFLLVLPSCVESHFLIRDTTFVVRTQWTNSGNSTTISTL